MIGESEGGDLVDESRRFERIQIDDHVVRRERRLRGSETEQEHKPSQICGKESEEGKMCRARRLLSFPSSSLPPLPPRSPLRFDSRRFCSLAEPVPAIFYTRIYCVPHEVVCESEHGRGRALLLRGSKVFEDDGDLLVRRSAPHRESILRRLKSGVLRVVGSGQ